MLFAGRPLAEAATASPGWRLGRLPEVADQDEMLEMVVPGGRGPLVGPVGAVGTGAKASGHDPEGNPLSFVQVEPSAG